MRRNLGQRLARLEACPPRAAGLLPGFWPLAVGEVGEAQVPPETVRFLKWMCERDLDRLNAIEMELLEAMGVSREDAEAVLKGEAELEEEP